MLLATDLDGTFLAGNVDQKSKLYQLIGAHPNIDLVFVTGRGLESVLPILADPTIPQPSYIICDVGSTIVDGKTLQPVHPIQRRIESTWPGTRAVEEALADLENLVRQEVPQERRCSYFSDDANIAEDVEARLTKLECDVVYSADRYLDVLPKGASKGATLEALAEFLGISASEILVAGDTMNDFSMFDREFKGVCVGKSETHLLNFTEHFANVYHAEQEGCGGILEAISYFAFLGPLGIESEIPNQQTLGESDLVIVYHRLPYEEFSKNGEVARRKPKSPNGIIPTLLSFFAEGRKGAWVAWSQHDDQAQKFQVHTDVDKENYENLIAAQVPLTTSEVDVFYRKFSKEAFWPTLHTFWERASFEEKHWQVFLDVNKKFAERTAAEAAENGTVWIHDYNLWMVPAYLRELRPDVTIAFFHHTYFPSADVFNVIPWRREIVGSLLQCDYIGFHIPRQTENFVDVARGVTPLEVTDRVGCAPRFMTYGCAVGLEEVTTEIKVNNRYIGLGSHPVGLDMKRIERVLESDETDRKIAQLREDLNGIRLILSVERLDFTKGILEKLEAFENLLDQHPDLLGKVTLLTVCVPAARGMSIYDSLKIQIEQTVGRINGSFASVGWTPVHFFFRAFPFEDLVAYYSLADIMWITPLRDGLNLVAKEYVATQGMTNGSGVLVLSEFTGAAAELKGALLTNPHDPRELVSTCRFALSMTKEEAKTRMIEAYETVSHYDIDFWAKDFLESISTYNRGRGNVLSIDNAKKTQLAS